MSLRPFFAPRARATAIFACGTILASAAVAFAQNTATTPAASPTPPKAASATPASTYQATITVDSAVMRSDASAESGYAFGALSKGQTVTVLETRAGWVRVRTEGPAFEGWGGYVTQLPQVKLSADGKSISVTGTASINAPNGDADFDPARSWKAIGFLTTGDTAPVLETIKGERETYYAVPLGSKTSGWLASTAITRDTAAQPTGDANTTKPTTGNTAEKPAEVIEQVKVADQTSAQPKTTKQQKPAEPKAPTAASKAIDEYKALEGKWNGLNKETCPLADLQELQVSYSNLSRNNGALHATHQAAMLRSVQIAQLVELRDMQEHAKRIAARGEDKAREVQAIEEWLRARQQYTAVGILNASVVYDGERLPRLYRLQDPTSGLTVAYLTEDSELKLSSMLGLVVGVKGDKKFDESLRRDIITPASLTVLRSDKETTISTPEKVGTGGSGEENGK